MHSLPFLPSDVFAIDGQAAHDALEYCKRLLWECDVLFARKEKVKALAESIYRSIPLGLQDRPDDQSQ